MGYFLIVGSINMIPNNMSYNIAAHAMGVAVAYERSSFIKLSLVSSGKQIARHAQRTDVILGTLC
jgi:hypothetical protein